MKKLLLLITFSLFACTIFNNLDVTPPQKEYVLVKPYVELLGETNAIIVWEIIKTSKSFLEVKDDKSKIFTISSTNNIFRLKLTNLKPGKQYFYRLAGTDDAFSKFRTLNKKRKNYSFIALGDNRTNYKLFKKIADTVAKYNVDFYIHSGDLLTNGKLKYQWYKEWFSPGNKMFQNAPVLIACGNHECPWDKKSYFHTFYPDRSQFKTNGYYSFQNGNVLFISINNFEPFKPGTKQYVWLENTLKSCKLPFIIATEHVSPFTGAGHVKDAAVKEARQFIVPLLNKYNVNLLISGHDHVYDRSEFEGTTYLITGGAGAPLYNPKTYLNPFSVVSTAVLNYVVFNVTSSNVTAKAYELSGEVIDNFSLKPRKMPHNFPEAFATFRPPWSNKIQSTDFDVYVRHFSTNEISGNIKIDISKDFIVLPTNYFKFVITADKQYKILNFKLKLKNKKQKKYPVNVLSIIGNTTNKMNFVLK